MFVLIIIVLSLYWLTLITPIPEIPLISPYKILGEVRELEKSKSNPLIWTLLAKILKILEFTLLDNLTLLLVLEKILIDLITS